MQLSFLITVTHFREMCLQEIGDCPYFSIFPFFLFFQRGRLVATFKGRVDFYHLIANGRPVSRAMEIEAATMNAQILREYKLAIEAADERRRVTMEEQRRAMEELEERRRRAMEVLKPYQANCSPGAPTDPYVQDYRIRFLK